MPIRWIVFDAVGTLIRPQPAVARAYWDVGRRHGSQLAEDEVARRFHSAYAASEQSDLQSADPADPAALQTTEGRERQRWRTIVANVFDDGTDGEACFAELFEHFARPAAWELFPDAPVGVRLLHERGFEIGVASNFDKRLVEVIRGQPIADCIRLVLPSSTLGYRKPSRYFFDRVCETAGCAAEDVLYVGDDRETDVLAARAAGLLALHIDRRALESAPGRVTDLRQILDLISR